MSDNTRARNREIARNKVEAVRNRLEYTWFDTHHLVKESIAALCDAIDRLADSIESLDNESTDKK